MFSAESNLPQEVEPDNRWHGVRRLSLTGAVFGTLAIWASATPSLVPRGAAIQAILAGLCLIVAYGIGAFVGWLYRFFELPVAPSSARRIIWIVLLVAAPIGLLVAGWLGHDWQIDQRELIGMEPGVSSFWIVSSLLGILVAGLLLMVGRGFVWLGKRVARFLDKYVPHRVGALVAVIVTAWFGYAVINGIVRDVALTSFDSIYQGKNEKTDPGVYNPDTVYASGGSNSDLTWDSLGRQGRQFSWQRRTAKEISKVTGDDAALEPIRAYVGLGSAEEESNRADIAVAELKRLGGFERGAIAVAGATGSGWIDPRSAAAIEFVAHGDVASVTMQYSYLPSWLSFLVDRERAQAASNDLINAVRVELNRMAPEDRPQLYVYGESLGTNAIDSAFTSVENISSTTDGALLVGPPGFDQNFRDIQAERKPGSPPWKPIYGDGALVRVAGSDAELTDSELKWETPNRVVYLAHASDPIIAFQTESRSAWLDPRGPGVPSQVRALPIVGGLQSVVDLFGANATPPGYGHVYDKTVVTAWSEILGPPSLAPAEVRAIQAAVKPIDDPK
ncbi:MAG: alpha/beta-hydrolase family protein [Thermoleophilaceae bacterium]|nr:alpha/beta-hydrolase family protein [Thermoleophilaceae bacterium]